MTEPKISSLSKSPSGPAEPSEPPTKATGGRAGTRSSSTPSDGFSRASPPPPAADAPRPEGGLHAAPTPPARPKPVTTRPASATSVDGIRAGWAGMPGRVEVFESAANGNRPVLVYVPPGCDLSKPTRVVTMFHGHGGAVGSTFGKLGWLERIRDVTEPGRSTAAPGADPQTLYIVPQAKEAPFTYWMAKPESLARLQEDALAAAAELGGVSEVNVGSRTVEAHSGGGLAIANAIKRHELAADKINLLDSTYADWGSTAVAWALDERTRGHTVTVDSWFTNHMEMVAHNRAMTELAKRRGAPKAVLTHDVTAETHNGVPAHHMGSR